MKALVWDGQGLVLYAKRLERGRFVWPQAKEGVLTLTTAQLAMLTRGDRLAHAGVDGTAVCGVLKSLILSRHVDVRQESGR